MLDAELFDGLGCTLCGAFLGHTFLGEQGGKSARGRHQNVGRVQCVGKWWMDGHHELADARR